MDKKIAETPRRLTRAELMQKLRDRRIEFPPSAILAQLHTLLNQSEELNETADAPEHTTVAKPIGHIDTVSEASAPTTATVASVIQPLTNAVTEVTASRPVNPHAGAIPRTTERPATIYGRSLNPTVGEFSMPSGSGHTHRPTANNITPPISLSVDDQRAHHHHLEGRH